MISPKSKLVLFKANIVILIILFIAASTAKAEAEGGRWRDRFKNRNDFNFMKGTKFWRGTGNMVEHKIVSKGTERSYYVYSPTNPPVLCPAPVVLAFHGGGGTGEGMDKLTGGITQTADQEGFIVVFPCGLNRCWNDGRTVNKRFDHDDLTFVSQMIDKIVADGIADPQRIYATGISNGGFFSQYLALNLPDKIAAIAPVAATLGDVHEPMMKGNPIPVLYILGVEDPLVPYGGGKIGGKVLRNDRGNCLSAEKSVKLWEANNHLSADAEQEAPLVDAVKGDGTKLRIKSNGNGNRRCDIVCYTIDGGGHTWPRGWQYFPVSLIGRTSQEMDANKLIWDFFKSHPK